MDNRPDWQKIIQAMSLLTRLGLILAANLGLGFFVGHLLDNFIGTDFLFQIIGLLMGVVSGIYTNYRVIKMIFENNKK